MTESILATIAKMLGINDEDTYFDDEQVVHINATFAILSQMGVGPGSFYITGRDETWSSFIGDDKYIGMVKQYVFMKVNTVFDPPSSSSLMEAYNSSNKELEWRMYSTTNYNLEEQDD